MGGEGIPKKQKHLKESMKLNWHFETGRALGGGVGVSEKILSVGGGDGVDIFWNYTLLKHNL